MARPPKDDAQKRSERFNLRLTLSELAHLQEQAENAGLMPHEYARRRILGHQVQAPPRIADDALLAALNRIGVNLNQLTRADNAGRDMSRLAAPTLAQLEELFAQIGERLGS